MNRSSVSKRSGVKKRFLLLLSATPVGNDLTELYNLIQLLRPGLLVMDAWSSSRSDDDARETFDRLAARLLDAKSAYQNASNLERALFSEDYEI